MYTISIPNFKNNSQKSIDRKTGEEKKLLVLMGGSSIGPIPLKFFYNLGQ